MPQISVEYMVIPGRLKLSGECAGVEQVFQFLEQVSEVFSHDTCGCCSGKNVSFGHRTAQGYDFYEVRCTDCGAKFSFGQRRDGGGLFPKTKDEKGNLLPDGGWSVYRPAPRQQGDPGF